MSNSKVYLLLPPAHDWSMPLLALPLLKACIPYEIKCQVIDVNVDFFHHIWGKDNLDASKNVIINALENGQLCSSVNASIELEKKIFFKQLGPKEAVLSRKVHVLEEWYDSNKVYEFLKSESETERILAQLVEQYDLEDAAAFAISIGVEDQIVPSFILMKILRRKFANVPIILGGNIVSRLSENLRTSKLKFYFDVLIVGEGEKSLPDILSKIYKASALSNKTVQIDSAQMPEYRLSQPIPDFDDIELDSYLCPVSVLPITINRKCDWGRCDFCAIHACWNGPHRERDLDEVIAEICYLIEKYNTRFFRIVDENVSTKLLGEFADRLLKRGLSIYYEIYTRFHYDFQNSSFVEKIYRSGCRQIFWGIENIDDDALRFMNKGTSQRIISQTLENTAKAGILNYCFILTGVPHIPVEKEERTIAYVIQNKNIHVAAIGSYVVDRLSPIEVNDTIREKYHISLYDVGDLTTEIGYLYEGSDQSKEVKQRTIAYIQEVYAKRSDYALSSLLNEEIRFILTQKYGNHFIEEYIAELGEKELEIIRQEAAERVVEERVLRSGEV